MRFFKPLAVAIIAVATLAALTPTAFAATPFYSASVDSSNSLRINVSNADSFSQINFYARQGGTVSTIITNLGRTDQFGSYAGTINPGLSISQGAIDTYVTVNGQQSTTVTINGSNNCSFNNNCNNNQISASQTNVTLNSGSSVSVSLFSNFNQSFYINSQPNSSVANANLSGNQLNIFGSGSGNTSVQVCASGSQFSCVTISISVNGGFGNGVVGFSSNDLSLTAGQSTNVFLTVNNISGQGFYVSSNSNPSVATASINGSNMSIFANGSNNGSGSTTFVVCTTFASSSCGNLRVNVNGSFGSGTVTFSNNNLNLNSGQSSLVYLSLASGVFNNGNSFNNSFYVSSNSNPNLASANINGTAMTVLANSNSNATGSSTFTVCASFSSSTCGTLFVSVNANSYNNLQLSPSSVLVSAGQSMQVSGFRNGFSDTLYLSSNSNPSVAYTTVNGNFLTVFGITAGSTIMNICTLNSNYCATLSVTVSGVLGTSTYANGTLIFDNGTIYIIYRNSKIGFTNYSAFTGLGFQAGNALSANTFSIPSAGLTVSSYQQAHPWGSWVKNGSTVYFVHQSGLIPITSWDIFLNNGGVGNLIVPMNSFDFQAPMLPIMTFNDSRLR